MNERNEKSKTKIVVETTVKIEQNDDENKPENKNEINNVQLNDRTVVVVFFINEMNNL